MPTDAGPTSTYPASLSPGTQNSLRRYFAIEPRPAGSSPSAAPAQAMLPAAPASSPTHTYTVRLRSVLAPPSRMVSSYQEKVLRQPEIQVHCSPRDFPNKLKLRKGQLLGPLSFELAADWDRRTRTLKCGCCCQDRMFGGNLWLDLTQQNLYYRRRLPVSNGASLACTAQCSYADVLRGPAKLRPMLGVRYEFGAGQGRASLGAHSIRLRQHVPITPMLNVEVCGSMQTPEPSAEVGFMDSQQTSVSLNGPFRFSIAEANLLIRI